MKYYALVEIAEKDDPNIKYDATDLNNESGKILGPFETKNGKSTLDAIGRFILDAINKHRWPFRKTSNPNFRYIIINDVQLENLRENLKRIDLINAGEERGAIEQYDDEASRSEGRTDVQGEAREGILSEDRSDGREESEGEVRAVVL